MADPVILNNVPDAEHAQKIAEFQAIGASVTAVQQPGGDWTLTITFPTSGPFAGAPAASSQASSS